MRKRFLGYLALAAAMMSGAKAEIISIGRSGNATAKEVEKLAEVLKDVKVIQGRPPFIGNIQMEHIGSGGIPPHIYGQYHVRKSTHKRSNRK